MSVCPWLCPGGSFDAPFTLYMSALAAIALLVIFWASRCPRKPKQEKTET